MNTLNNTQLQILRRFGPVVRDVRFFTSAAFDIIVSAPTVQKHLDSLLEAGYIKHVTGGYRITAAGVKLAEQLAKAAAPTVVTNATSKQVYQPTELLRSNRPGAMDHQRFQSFGTLC